MKMDVTMIIVSTVMGSIGVSSAILGFLAEGKKLTRHDIRVYGNDECIYPPNPAPVLAVSAAVLLLLVQIMVSAVSSCCGCCKSCSRAVPSEANRMIGNVCAFLSWIAAGVAWVMLLNGAAWNANMTRKTAPNCLYLKNGIFAGAAVLTLAATALGVTSYIKLRSQPTDDVVAPAAASNKAHEPGAIAMGHPQVPMTSQGLSQQQPPTKSPPA